MSKGWRRESERHSLSARGIRTGRKMKAFGYRKDPSVMKSGRSIHKLTPEYNSLEAIPMIMPIYEQVFLDPYHQLEGVRDGEEVLVEIFYWTKESRGEWSLAFKEHKMIYEVNAENLLRRADGERRRIP